MVGKLYQNNPNPFNTNTTIQYEIPEKCNAEILITYLDGKFVQSYKLQNSGKSSITINANQLQAGIYLYTLLCDNKEVDSKKMILTQ